MFIYCYFLGFSSRTSSNSDVIGFRDLQSPYAAAEKAAILDDTVRPSVRLALALQRDSYPLVCVLEEGFPKLVEHLLGLQGTLEPIVLNHDPVKWAKYLSSTGRLSPHTTKSLPSLPVPSILISNSTERDNYIESDGLSYENNHQNNYQNDNKIDFKNRNSSRSPDQLINNNFNNKNDKNDKNNDGQNYDKNDSSGRNDKNDPRYEKRQEQRSDRRNDNYFNGFNSSNPSKIVTAPRPLPKSSSELSELEVAEMAYLVRSIKYCYCCWCWWFCCCCYCCCCCCCCCLRWRTW